MPLRLRARYRKLVELLREVTPPAEEVAARLRSVERHVILPVKACYLALLCYHLLDVRWFSDAAVPRSVAQQVIGRFFLIYLAINLVISAVLIGSKKLPLHLVQRVVFASSFLDSLFLGALTFASGGFDSRLYWVFIGLIIRNAMIIPVAVPQLFLNFFASLCYFVAGLLDVFVADEFEPVEGVNFANTIEPFLLRLFVLWLTIAWCYIWQVLAAKQRRAAEESRERATREARLQSAGRLASEIAHQIKNPLGIIYNSTYALRRLLETKSGDPLPLVDIIHEEVRRTSGVITELMGQGQLADGKLERLEINDVLDQAVNIVFPASDRHGIKIERDFVQGLPPLLMQQRHLSEIFLNILKNAREAMGSRPGRVLVKTRLEPDDVVAVTIADDGPGISPTKVNKIFDPYYTTKETGTGLGLAAVKNHVELYRGRIEVESELGKGARFILHLPTRTLTKPQS